MVMMLDVGAFIESLGCEDELLGLMKSSISTIEDTISKYSLPSIVLSFNGGKDACVIFHLVRYVLQKMGHGSEFGSEQGLNVLYFYDPAVEFKEITTLLNKYKEDYEVNYLEHTGSFKDGMEELVGREPVGMQAVFMGMRRGDPGLGSISEQTDKTSCRFQKSSADWPEFMRVYPILEWEYRHVWRFLRECSIPYCSLYDVGYTSIGNIRNTIPNPALMDKAVDTNTNVVTTVYRPAYELTDASLERANRRTHS